MRKGINPITNLENPERLTSRFFNIERDIPETRFTKGET